MAEIRPMASRLETLLQIGDQVAGARDLQHLLHILATNLTQVADFDYVAVILHEPETDTMRLHRVEFLIETTAPPPMSSPMDEGPSWLVFRTQHPLVLDVERETRFP